MGKAQISEIDRLIELASDEKPHRAVVTEMPHLKNGSQLPQIQEDPKDTKLSMWRILLQLRVLLPYLARLLPVLEKSVLGTNLLGGAAPVPHRLDTSRFDEGLAGLEGAHKNLTVQLENQSLEIKSQSASIKFLQEQVDWLGKAIKKQAERQEEIAAGIASLRRLAITWALVIVVVLATLIAVDFLKPTFLK
jgi:hypothetical protein